MPREFEPSTIENEFVHTALKEGIRTDGRELLDVRPLSLSFNGELGYAECRLGETRVAAQISAEVTRPSIDRPYEGTLSVSCEISPLASAAYEAGRSSEDEILIAQKLEKTIRRSGAVDLESLCISASSKVWAIRVDLLFLNDQGNLVDCASIAAVAALRHFRRPDVTVVGSDVTVHSFEERVPIPLAIHHSPFCITFAFFGDGSITVVDPDHLEEQLSAGSMSLVVNSQREICVFSKTGGAPISTEEIMRLVHFASKRAIQLEGTVQKALDNKH